MAWSREGGIQGFGIAPKHRDGRATGDLALKVYVERKLPESEVATPVPPVVKLPDGRTALTDVEPIGKLRLQSNFGRVRPAMPGFGIGCQDMSGGTIGCMVRRGKTVYILSNSHVLAKTGAARPGDMLIQPCRDDGGASPADVVARLADFVELVPGGATNFPNVVDAAIAEVTRPEDSTAFIRRIGVPKGYSTLVRRGMQVQKTGRTTDYTIGVVEDADFAGVLELPLPDGSFQPFGFRNQVLCTHFTEGGDSGAAVLNMNGSVVGLHVGGSARASIFCRIAPVLSELRVDLVTS